MYDIVFRTKSESPSSSISSATPVPAAAHLASSQQIASNQQQQQRKTFKTCCFEFCRSTTLKATACAACDSPAWKSRLGSGECKKERSAF